MSEEKSTQKKSGLYFYANGKRKTAVALVRLYPGGKGTITINKKSIDDFLTVKTLLSTIKSPFKVTDTSNKFDVVVEVRGGGVVSQAEAIRHGIAKGLIKYNELLRPALKKVGLITRDSRTKERKKYGLHRARRAPQFSKR